ncbi:MAG: hypothetical protein AAF141_16125, partial [Pseudomonadota bacterium]
MSRYGRWHVPVQVCAAIVKAVGAVAVFVLVMLLAAYLFLSVRPFDASSMVPSIERALARALPEGMSASIDGPVLQMRGPRLAISSKSIGLALPDGSVARADAVDFVLSGFALLQGKVGLHELAIESVSLPPAADDGTILALPSLGQEGVLQAVMDPVRQAGSEVAKRVSQLDVRTISIGQIRRGDAQVAQALTLTSKDGLTQMDGEFQLRVADRPVTIPLAASVDAKQVQARFEVDEAADLFPDRSNNRPPAVFITGPMSGAVSLPMAQGDGGELRLSLPQNVLKIEDEPDKAISAPDIVMLLEPSRDRVEISPSQLTVGTLETQ